VADHLNKVFHKPNKMMMAYTCQVIESRPIVVRTLASLKSDFVPLLHLIVWLQSSKLIIDIGQALPLLLILILILVVPYLKRLMCYTLILSKLTTERKNEQ